MQLLNVHTLRLTTFFDRDVPRYAILSHTWEDEEILFEDIRDAEKPFPEHKKGWLKVKRSCEQALHDGYEWMWVDTCCIDKSSSAELSEAINSMFRWYLTSSVCYAYLSDIKITNQRSSGFEKSRWFTRGWTLQELIAPRRFLFFDSQWHRIGERHDLARLIKKATGIPMDLLQRGDMDTEIHIPGTRTILERYSVAQRFSWASKRLTTRVEDEAYCLLGLFGVNMPLLYGEGSQAFLRLQQEILKLSDDHSILAFRGDHGGYGLLTKSPKSFSESAGIIQAPRINTDPAPQHSFLAPSGKTLEIGLHLCSPRRDESLGRDLATVYLGVLDCVFASDPLARVAILLKPLHDSSTNNEFHRLASSHLLSVSPTWRTKVSEKVTLIFNQTTLLIQYPWRGRSEHKCLFDIFKGEYRIVRIYFQIPNNVSKHVDVRRNPAFLRMPRFNMEISSTTHTSLHPQFNVAGSIKVEASPNTSHRIDESRFWTIKSFLGKPTRREIDLNLAACRWSPGVTRFVQADAIPEFFSHMATFGIYLNGCIAFVLVIGTVLWPTASDPLVGWEKGVVCLLLDWGKICSGVAETDSALLKTLNDMQKLDPGSNRLAGLATSSTTVERKLKFKLLAEWLRANDRSEAIAGIARLGSAAQVHRAEGTYHCELVSDNFFGEPFLNIAVNFTAKIPEEAAK